MGCGGQVAESPSAPCPPVPGRLEVIVDQFVGPRVQRFRCAGRHGLCEFIAALIALQNDPPDCQDLVAGQEFVLIGLGERALHIAVGARAISIAIFAGMSPRSMAIRSRSSPCSNR